MPLPNSSVPPSALPARALLALGCGLAALSPAAAQEATPQRPSLSFNAYTVDSQVFEMEWGGFTTEEASSVPAFLKYGFTDWLEGELGFDAVRQVDLGDEEITSRGDLFIGTRAVLPWDVEDAAFAAVAWVKAPTARDKAGSGEADFGVVGVASGDIPGGLTLDLNIWLTALGTDEGHLGQQQAVATLGLPVPGRWSVYVEGAYQNTAVAGDGLFANSGVGYTASPRAVFDAAVGVGSSRGYPDWTLTVGWTVLTAGSP